MQKTEGKMMLCIPPDENAHPHPEIVERLPRGCAFVSFNIKVARLSTIY
jgi:hypothetical protein